MENKERELEAELAKIKEKKEKKVIEENLKAMTLVGKCYSSHVIQRKVSGNYDFTLTRVIGRDWDEKSHIPYAYTGETIHCWKYGDKSGVVVNTFRGSIDRLWTREISEEDYLRVKTQLLPLIEKSTNEIRNSFKRNFYTTNRDSANFSKKDDLFLKAAITYIELSEEILELLTWNNHPYLVGDKLYKSNQWLEMIIDIRDKMEENAYSWGGFILERDLPRIRALSRFITNNK